MASDDGSPAWEREVVVNADTARWWGRGDIAQMFPTESGPLRTAPFPRARRSRSRRDYEKSLVSAAIRAQRGVEDVDPRKLSATQPSVILPGVQHYMTGRYEVTGETYEPGLSIGNKTPLVYVRDGSEAMILAGHHRSTAALLHGEPVRAIVVRGTWGEKR